MFKRISQSSLNFRRKRRKDRKALVVIIRTSLSVFFILFGISHLIWSKAGYKNMLGFVLILLGIFALLNLFVKGKSNEIRGEKRDVGSETTYFLKAER
jgi:uncharacterized membrane protein